MLPFESTAIEWTQSTSPGCLTLDQPQTQISSSFVTASPHGVMESSQTANICTSS